MCICIINGQQEFVCGQARRMHLQRMQNVKAQPVQHTHDGHIVSVA
jgi:hypothetical protein